MSNPSVKLSAALWVIGLLLAGSCCRAQETLDQILQNALLQE